MDRISSFCNHKCPKRKIRPRDCPNDYSCRFTLDSSKGGGDSFEGKVSELTSSGIKRGSAGPLGPSPVYSALIHELFRYERLTRFSCLSDFSVSQGTELTEMGLQSLFRANWLRHCWNFHFARCIAIVRFYFSFFSFSFIVIYRFVQPTCFIILSFVFFVDRQNSIVFL